MKRLLFWNCNIFDYEDILMEEKQEIRPWKLIDKVYPQRFYK